MVENPGPLGHSCLNSSVGGRGVWVALGGFGGFWGFLGVFGGFWGFWEKNEDFGVKRIFS